MKIKNFLLMAVLGLSMTFTSCDDILGEWSRPVVNTNTGSTPKQGALTGKFTINAEGKQVYFSQGNLQWSGTNGWRFASNQWDIIGSKANNTSPTSSNDNYMDLFCWGATGLNSVAPNTATSYLSGSSVLSGNNDWGTNMGSGWRTLTSEEWVYLFNTRASGAIFKMRGLPNGTVMNVKNNLFVLCKKAGDQRLLQMWGADIRNTQTLADGSAGKVTLNFNNNWSTNNDLTNGSIFSASQWTATSNNFGKLVKDGNATLNGTLEVAVADISATDLMEQPCPPYVATTANDRHMHRADALDGSANNEFNVNLKFKNKDNDIVRNNVGDTRWYK